MLFESSSQALELFGYVAIYLLFFLIGSKITIVLLNKKQENDLKDFDTKLNDKNNN